MVLKNYELELELVTSDFVIGKTICYAEGVRPERALCKQRQRLYPTLHKIRYKYETASGSKTTNNAQLGKKANRDCHPQAA